MSGLVGSGDPDNVEARAARDLLARLFDDFVREDRLTCATSCSTMATRSCARRLRARWSPSAACRRSGLHHASATNAFNLADDFVEPFRPVRRRAGGGARRWAFGSRRNDGRGPARDGGRAVARSASAGETFTLLAASEKAAESFVRAMEGASAALLRLPQMGLRARARAMTSEEARFMWMFVFFDLPVGTKTERRTRRAFAISSKTTDS